MFPCEFCEIFKNTFLQNTSGRLLPHILHQKQGVLKFRLWRLTKWEDIINNYNQDYARKLNLDLFLNVITIKL